MLRAPLLALLLLSPALGSQPETSREDSAEAFEQELDRVQNKMEEGDWDQALRRLERALESHADQEYVLAHLGRIELALKRCTFWEEHGEVDLAAGLQGALEYDLRRGTLKLTYEPEAPTDFQGQGMAKVLPVVFDGPYSVELEDGPDPSVIVCARGVESVLVNFSRVFYLGVGNPGHKKPTERSVELRRRWLDRDGELQEERKTKDFTSKRDLKERVYRVAVSGTSVKASFNGRSVASCRKDPDLWGQVAFALTIPKSKITVEGQASGWLQSRLDALVEADWKEFEQRWSLEAHLPSWLTAAKERGADPAEELDPGLPPSELQGADLEQWNRAVELLGSEAFSAAHEAVSPLLVRQPRLAEGHRLRAAALLGERRRAAALEALEAGALQVPGSLPLRRDLVELQLMSGEFQRCLEEIGAAIADGLPAGALQDLAVTANKALYGPAWSSKSEFESRHYRVSSDLTRDVCRTIALELEETFRHISRRLQLGEHLEAQKFQVYVFSGSGRYLDYISDVFGGRGENTLGMYSPSLKQLLVLDSSDSERLLHTVRHEGFHQLLDSELERPPLWLNEGLAEYFAAAREERGGWRDGKPNEGRLAALKGPYQGRLLPLEDFLYQSHAEFMRDPGRSYAQAWGLVHFLRHSSRENQALLESLIAGLLSGKDNRAALEAAFEGRDLSALDAELAAFLAKL
jgi:tetratricopeptide (TPR) repeat protein